MPVCSFVVHPRPGQTAEAVAALNSLQGCEATPDDAGKVIVLVIETDTIEEVQDLARLINQLPPVATSALCFGQLDPLASSITRTPKGA